MLPVLERRHAVVNKARRTAPHRDIAVFDTQPAHGVGAPLAAPQEYGGQAERDRHDWSPLVILVAVLMQAQFGPRNVPVDQTRIGIIVVKPALRGGANREVNE